MTEQSQENQDISQESIFIGQKMKAAREKLGLSIKDVSYQLRLKESVIEVIETDQLPGDIPLAFAKGYLRTYGRFLNLASKDIDKAILTLLPATSEKPKTPTKKNKQLKLANSKNIMRFSTSVITATMAGLVVSWWFNHQPDTSHIAYVAIQNKATEPTLPTKIELSNASAPKTNSLVESIQQSPILSSNTSTLSKLPQIDINTTTKEIKLSEATPNTQTTIPAADQKPAPAAKASETKQKIAQNNEMDDDYDDYDDEDDVE